MKSAKRPLYILTILALVLLLSACGDNTATTVSIPAATTTTSTTIPATDTPVVTAPAPTNPKPAPTTSNQPETTIASPATSAASSNLQQILDLSFPDNLHGWALGTDCGAGSTCALALRVTADGGKSWQALPNPPATPAFTGDTPDKNKARHVLFINPQDGWLFGPGLFSTHDGGKTWKNENRGEDIIAMAPVGKGTWAVGRTCSQQQECALNLLVSGDNGHTWVTSSGAPKIQAYDANVVAVNPSEIFIFAENPLNRAAPPAGTIPAGSALYFTRDGGKNWQESTSPCAQGGGVNDRFAALDAKQLWVLCGSGPGAGNQLKKLYRSGDVGKSWQQVATNGMGTSGYIDSFAITAPQTLWLSLDRGTLLKSNDGGQNWQVAIPYEQANPGDGTVGPIIFTDPQHGWLAGQQQIFYSTDGGKNWIGVEP